MRCFSLSLALVLLPVLLIGQSINFAISPEVRDYLGLTLPQMQAVEKLRVESRNAAAGRANRANVLAGVIRAEETKPDPDAAKLGLAVAEQLQIYRDDRAAAAKLTADTISVLTADQLVRLQPLRQAQALSSLTTQTVCEGFMEALPPPTLNGVLQTVAVRTGDFAQASFCGLTPIFALPFPSRRDPIAKILASSPLSLYLDLSLVQIAGIRALQLSAEQFRSPKVSRFDQVEQELLQETLEEVLDPFAIGLRRVELVSIRRELDKSVESLPLQIQDQLTAAQRVRLQALEEARRLAELEGAARTEGFLEPNCGSVWDRYYCGSGTGIVQPGNGRDAAPASVKP